MAVRPQHRAVSLFATSDDFSVMEGNMSMVLFHALFRELAEREIRTVTVFPNTAVTCDLPDLVIRLVDRYDIFLGKLFSAREKDLDDLRAMSPLLDRAVLDRQSIDTTRSLQAEHKLLENATKNWRIVYGTPLPR
jgi:hypothetical protein